MKTTYSVKMLKGLGAALEKAPVGDVTEEILRGGPGSGHYGHSGRSERVGGSEPGGLAVGRAEADDAEQHFKWSGKGELRRSRSPHVELAIKTTKSDQHFEVNGAVDSRGRQKPGKVNIKVGDKTLELDHDELHSLRSKMRYMKMTEDKNVTEIARRDIVRGDTLSVKIGDKSVDIPINEQSTKMVESAARTIQRSGYSFALEDDKTILKAVDRIKEGENPITVMKKEGFSKAGQMATLHFLASTSIRTGEMDERVADKTSAMSKGGRWYVKNAAKEAKAQLNEGQSRFEELSGTQAMKHWKQSACLVASAEK